MAGISHRLFNYWFRFLPAPAVEKPEPIIEQPVADTSHVKAPVIEPAEPATAEEAMSQNKTKHGAIIGQGMYEIVEDTENTAHKRGFLDYIKEEVLGMAPKPKINKRKKKETK